MSALVQVMACRLFGAKPLPEPMLAYCQLGLLGTNLSEIRIGIPSFSFKKMHLKLSAKRGPSIVGDELRLRKLTRHGLHVRFRARLADLLWVDIRKHSEVG